MKKGKISLIALFCCFDVFPCPSLLCLPASLVFDLSGGNRNLGVPVILDSAIKTLDGNADVVFVQSHITSKLNGLFLSVSPVAVMEWVRMVVEDTEMPANVKAELLRADRMASVYRYLLEEHSLHLVKKVVVGGELIELENLIWQEPEFDVPVKALSSIYPSDMEGIFVKELGVAERLRGRTAFTLWQAEAQPGMHKSNWTKRGVFLLECIADGIHMLKQDEIDSMLLLTAGGTVSNNVCLKTDSVILYNRLGSGCVQLAYMPPVVQMPSRTRLLKLYEKRSSMYNVAVDVKFSLKVR